TCAATMTPDGRTIAAVCGKDTGTQIMWVSASSFDVLNKEAPLLERVNPSVNSIVFRPDGWGLALGTSSGMLHLFDLSNGDPFELTLQHGSPLTSVAYSPDGVSILTAGEGGAALLWDVPDHSGVPLEKAEKLGLRTLENVIRHSH